MGRGLGWVTHRGPFQPLPCCDSVTGAEPAAEPPQHGGARGGRSRVEVLPYPPRQGTCGGDTTSSSGCSRAVAPGIAQPSRGCSGPCVTASAATSRAHLRSPAGCLGAPPSPGRWRAVPGRQLALTPQESVVQEDGVLSQRWAWRLPVHHPGPRGTLCHRGAARHGVPAPRGPGFPGTGQRGFHSKKRACCTGGKEQHGAGMVGEIPAVHLPSDALDTKGEQTISEERININSPPGEEHFRSSSVAWLLGEP